MLVLSIILDKMVLGIISPNHLKKWGENGGCAGGIPFPQVIAMILFYITIKYQMKIPP
jgi:hypothetical protein